MQMAHHTFWRVEAMKLWLLISIISIVLLSCKQEPVVIPKPVEALTTVQKFMVDPEAVARGKALFVGSCVDYCHALEPADTDATFLFECAWLQSQEDATIAETVRSGIPNTRMVGFGFNFPDNENDIWKLIAFLRSNQTPCREDRV